MRKLIEGKDYLIVADDKRCRCRLTNIQSYPATGMPRDFMFTPLKGEKPLAHHETFYPSFPLPEMLLGRFDITPLDDVGVPLSTEVLQAEDLQSIFKKMRADDPLGGDSSRFTRLLDKMDTFELTEDQKAEYRAILTTRLEALKAEISKES